MHAMRITRRVVAVLLVALHAVFVAAPAAVARGSEHAAVHVVASGELSAADRLTHEAFMQRALALARTASGGPFGAVIVARKTGEVVCQGSNRGNENPVLHAEMVAILNCSEERKKFRGTLTLYSSAEPCPMCAAAIAWAGIDRLVYATSIETLVGYGVGQIRIDSASVARAAGDLALGKGSIIAGVLEAEADRIYERWASELASRSR